MSSNVIRANFGARSRPEVGPSQEASAEERVPERVFGHAAGYAVALVRNEAAAEGPVLEIVVGPLAGNLVETVAILPSTPEGAADADVTAMAILRTLEVIGEAARMPAGV